MKEILKITASLTGVCIAAAVILGLVYTQTEAARKQIEERERQHIVRGLLGFEQGEKAPEDLNIFTIHRYVIKHPEEGTILGYVVPGTEPEEFFLLTIDLEGNPLEAVKLDAQAEQINDQGPRDQVVKSTLPGGSQVSFAETYFVAEVGGERYGYVLPGITQGFKTFVKLMVSLNPQYTVTGVAITESEEDPGLGAEIEQEYFRNQFVGKTQQVLKDLKVVKEPLPDQYLPALEPEKAKRKGVSEDKIEEIKQKYVDDDIYALTGATISSRAVTRGVKNTVRKFAYRFDILKNAIEQKNVKVAF